MHTPQIDFLGIGAMRCATTWISRCLEDHPDLFIPPGLKEVHFFDKFRMNHQDKVKQRWNYEKGLNWYLDLFNDAQEDQLVGEYTPSYLTDPEAAGLIHQHFPETKLILSLRDPIARLKSHHQYVRRNHPNIPDDLDEAIQTCNDTYHFLENGLYGKYLETYLQYFAPEQILILFFEDIHTKPKQVCQQLYTFLGVDSSYLPTVVTQRVNSSSEVKNRSVLRTMRFIKQTIKKSSWVRRNVESLGGVRFGRWINRLNQSQNSKATEHMKPDSRAKLQQYYTQDIERLESLTNRDLSKWKSGA